ncbi:MAG TPA: hypothetical protein PLV83_04205 [Bacilli bacterium]|nr:hypothetical protein [Bacilli bacterium]
MKKILLIIFILMILFLLRKEKSIIVFNELDVDSNAYYIIMDNLNTNNFNDYFKGLEVLCIYPNINPIYENKIKLNYIYDNINNFKIFYINSLKDKGYYIEANKYLLNPIIIRKVLVYGDIIDIKNKIRGKKYELVRCNSCSNFIN